MQPGTIVKLPDGRIGTTVYHGLDGYGIRWGEHDVVEKDLPAPDAMLRDPYPHAIEVGLECVGDEFEIVRIPHHYGRLPV